MEANKIAFVHANFKQAPTDLNGVFIEYCGKLPVTFSVCFISIGLQKKKLKKANMKNIETQPDVFIMIYLIYFRYSQ